MPIYLEAIEKGSYALLSDNLDDYIYKSTYSFLYHIGDTFDNYIEIADLSVPQIELQGCPVTFIPLSEHFLKEARNEYQKLVLFENTYRERCVLDTSSITAPSNLQRSHEIRSKISIVNLLLADINEKLKKAKRNLRHIRKLLNFIRRLQYIAREIRNRISESPTPIQKEPPIGGVKVGGEQYGWSHAA